MPGIPIKLAREEQRREAKAEFEATRAASLAAEKRAAEKAAMTPIPAPMRTGTRTGTELPRMATVTTIQAIPVPGMDLALRVAIVTARFGTETESFAGDDGQALADAWLSDRKRRWLARSAIATNRRNVQSALATAAGAIIAAAKADGVTDGERSAIAELAQRLTEMASAIG